MRRTVVAVVLLAGTGAAVVAVRDRIRTESAPTTTAAVLEVAEVSTGDLSTTESIDGTLTETGSITVVHRIEGQTSSSSSSSSSTVTAPSAAATSGATAPIAAAAEALPAGATTEADCAIPDATVVADPTSTTAAVAPTGPADPSATTTSIATPADVPTPPPDGTTTTSTTVAPTSSSTPQAATSTTVCPTADPSATSTTASAGDVTTTAAPTGAGPIGAVPSGGAAPSLGAGGGAASSPGGATVSASSSTRITQLVTWVAPTGTAIGSGDALYSIEGSPVTAMYGDLPAWRSLSTASDDGVDVVQLESNLRALGFDPDIEMTIDQTFDGDTQAAVERWQAAIGVDVSGEVALGSVVFVPAATTVTSTSQTVGDEIGDGDTVVTLAGTTQQIVITVPTEDQPFVEPGTAVTVSDTAATVVALRSAESSGTVTVQAVISPSATLDVADGSAVKVRLSIEKATSVLLVPAEALVSRLDGTYAVQTSADPGRHEFVTVELLGVANGMAGVRGEGLTEGTTVWMPA